MTTAAASPEALSGRTGVAGRRRPTVRWWAALVPAVVLLAGAAVLLTRAGSPSPAAVTTPATAGGLSLTTAKPSLTFQAASLARELAREHLGRPVTGVYASGAGPLEGVVVGGGNAVPGVGPAALVQRLAAGLKAGALGAQVTAVGPLVTTATPAVGGTQVCVGITTVKIPLGVCGWQDARSVGYALAFDRDGARLSATLAALRPALERR